MTRAFVTSAKAAVPAFEGAVPITFTIDGDEFVAYPPTPGQFALLLAAQADSRDVAESMAGIIDFLNGMLDEDGQTVFRERLLDRDDPFDFDMVNEIVAGLIEEWTARPTPPPSASASSRTSGGRKSTARPRSTVKT